MFGHGKSPNYQTCQYSRHVGLSGINISILLIHHDIFTPYILSSPIPSLCVYIYIRSLSCSFRSYPVLSYSILSHPTPSSIWHVQALNRFTFPKRWNQEFKDSVFDALNLALHRDFHRRWFCVHIFYIRTFPFWQSHHFFKMNCWITMDVSIKVGDFVDGFTMAGVGEHQGCWILFESRRDAVGHPAKLFGNAWWRMKQDKVKRAEYYDLPRLVGDRCDMSHFAVFPTVIYLHLGSVKSYCMCQKPLMIYIVCQEKDAVLLKKAMTIYIASIKVDSRFGFVGHLAKWCHMHGPFETKSTGKRGNPPDLGLPFNKQPFLHIFAIQKSEYNHDRHDTWQSWFGIATFSPFLSICTTLMSA